MPPRLKLGTEPYPYLPKRMCECAIPKVLRASRRSGVLIIPKSARLRNLESWLIDATGYAPGLPSPKRPISVLAQNLWEIPSVLIQVLFSLPICLLKPVRTPVAILGSLGVCIYVPASRHWLISYSPIHLI